MKALVAVLTIALAGAGLSGAVLTGTLPWMTTDAADPEPAQGWEVLQAFTGEAADLTTGTLDLRTFWGNIQVLGWSEPSYEITVYQRTPEQSGQSVGDAKIEAAFKETRDDGLGLNLVVQRTGSYSISVGQDSWTDIAVVAHVPGSIAWSTAYVCSGEDGAGLVRETLGPVLDALRDPGAEEATCVPGTPMADLGLGRVSLQDDDDSEEEAAEFPFSLAGLHGGELTVLAQYADLALDTLSFERARVMTQYGEVLGGIDAPELAVLSQYGRIGLTGAADNADIFSQYGDLYLSLTPGRSGAYNVETQYGEVVLGLGPEGAYDIEGQTQYGDVLIILDGVEYGSDDDSGSAAAPPALLKAGLPLLDKDPAGPKAPSRDHGGDAVAKARSESFADAGLQTVVKAATQYGDVLVTNGEMPEAGVDDEGLDGHAQA